MLADEMNKKEVELATKIKFYKENKEQLLRIKFLEVELNGLVETINQDYFKKQEELRQQCIIDERNKFIKERCNTAFKMYQTRKDLSGIRDIKQLSTIRNEIEGNLPILNCVRCVYLFEEVNNGESYNVTCIMNRDDKNPIRGTFTINGGFKLTQ